MVAVGYVLAFSLAVLTRQMLSSVLFASLAIFLWVTAPLISSRLAFLDPSPQVFSSPRASAFVLEDLRFSATLIGQAVIVAFCVIASIGAALIGCARERVIRLGYKPLAWTAALLVLLLFSAAMSELGNSLAVRAQVVLAPRLSLGKVPMLNQAVAAACSGDRCYALLQC